MTIYRYIIRKITAPFLYSFGVIMFVLIMQLVADLLHKILEKDLDPVIVIEIFLCSLGWMIVLAVPMAVLVASLQTFGAMSADNEILIIKSSGQNLCYLITPLISAALVMAVILVFFNNLVYPDANHRASVLMSDISRKKPAAMIEPDVLIKDFKDYALHVKEVENSTGKMKGVTVFANEKGKDQVTTVAESAFVKTTADGNYLKMTLFDGENHNVGRGGEEKYIVSKFKKQVVFVKNIDSEFHRSERDYRGDREKSAQSLLKDIQKYRKKKNKYELEFKRDIDKFTGFIDELDSLAELFKKKDSAKDSLSAAGSFSSWAARLKKESKNSIKELERQKRRIHYKYQRILKEKKNINKYLVEVHKKYSLPAACIVFVLIGAPLGIMARGGGIAVGVSYSIFFFIIYWVFLIGGEVLADNLVIPPWVAMWSANILIGICGIYLTTRMIKERTFISFSPVKKISDRIVLSGIVQVLLKTLKRITAELYRGPVWLSNRVIGRLPTYLIKIFTGYIVGVFLALIIMFVVVDYISNLKRLDNAGFKDIVLYYWFYLPWFIKLIAPIGILLASMFSIGRMVKYSELTAIKSGGISFRRFTLPLLFLGLIISAADFYVGEKVLTYAKTRRKQLYQEIKTGEKGEDVKGEKVVKRNFYYFGNNKYIYSFGVFRTHPQKSNNVSRQKISGSRIQEHLQAEKFLYLDDDWFFVNGWIRRFSDSGYSAAEFDTLFDSTLDVTPGDMVAEIKSIDEMSYWELSDAMDKARRQGENVDKYRANLLFKIALPFMDFIVILLGISITARGGSKNGAVLFGIGLLLAFSFWILSQIGIAMGQNEQLNPYIAAWGGNIVYMLIGLFLYWRVS